MTATECPNISRVQILNAHNIHALLGASPVALSRLPYRYWRERKRSGGWRNFAEPAEPLKEAQRVLLREVWEHFSVHDAAHGYVTGRSALTNAAAHAGARVVVKLDLRDFFPSISSRRIRSFLISRGYESNAAELLALLATCPERDDSRRLAQGAPTSQTIANVLCWRLDTRLTGLASSQAYIYTRYSDDLTFSWHEPEPPDTGELIRCVRRIVCAEGFSLSNKTSVIRATSEEAAVTGVVVGARQRAPRHLRRRLRAVAHKASVGRSPVEAARELARYMARIDPAAARPAMKRLGML